MQNWSSHSNTLPVNGIISNEISLLLHLSYGLGVDRVKATWTTVRNIKGFEYTQSFDCTSSD